MNIAPPTSNFTNRNDSSDSLSLNPTTNVQQDDICYRTYIGTKNESQASMSFPTALNATMETSTKTDNAGQFALKRSQPLPSQKLIGTRIEPTLHNSPETRLQDVDDRRRLPSYTRDATSEIVSFYETSIQKASSRRRVFENSDYRSYSMTQTSFSPNSLSNYRSYTSLRSQPELGLMPRPRSPFLYPTRLKRLGYRPSSPVLAEQRIECMQKPDPERTAYNTSTDVHLTSPFNRHKERPQFPSASQSDVNSTYPFVPVRSQFGSRSSLLMAATDSLQDRTSHPETVFPETLPSVDNFRSIPSPSSYHRRSPSSSTGKISKSYAPSPLYYDYTEDFGLENAGGDENTAQGTPQIPFILDKITHSMEHTTSETLEKYDFSPQGPSTGGGLHALAASSIPECLELSNDKSWSNGKDNQSERSVNVTQDIIPLYLDREPIGMIVDSPSERKIFSKSNQVASILDEKFSLKSDTNDKICPDLPDTSDRKEHGFNVFQLPENKDTLDQYPNNKRMSASTRTSSFRLSTYLPNFPNAPTGTILGMANTDIGAIDQDIPRNLAIDPVLFQKTKTSSAQITDLPIGFGYKEPNSDFTMKASRQLELDPSTEVIKRSTTTHNKRIRSSRYYSIDHGLLDLAQLISKFEFSNGSFTAEDIQTQFTGVNAPLSMQTAPVLIPLVKSKESSALYTTSVLQTSPLQETQMRITRFRSDGDLRASTLSTRHGSHSAVEKKPTKSESYKKREENEPYHKNIISLTPKRSHSRRENTIIAPTAISPAKFLRLKKSVPQLMKALPPVPQNSASEGSLFLVSSSFNTTTPQIDSELKKTTTNVELIPKDAAPLYSVNLQPDSKSVVDFEISASPPLRFRIRSRLFDSQRSYSPANSRPWNLDENYPWHSQQSTVRLSSLRVRLTGFDESPKFKLRVTRPPTSPSGTIRINPDGKSSFDLRSPKDLFTSSSNLNGIFRQVSRHFSSREPNNVKETAPGNDIEAPFVISGSNQIDESHGCNLDLLNPPSPTAVCPINSTEVRSFFSEDSSQVRGHNSFRNRISNLRARIPNRYTSRQVAISNQNDAPRENTGSCLAAESRSKLNISYEQEDEYGMPIATMRNPQFRSKVSRWFRDARLAVRRGVKLHSSADMQCIPHR